MAGSVRIVKIGGSLLSSDKPAERLRAWLSRRQQSSPQPLVLVVGGGVAVDELRRLDAVQPLGGQTAHWLAIDLMVVNTRAVAAWLGVDVIEGGQADLLEALRELTAIAFDPRRWLREQEPRQPGVRLPVGWSTTSDSIAARLAEVLGAELTLLKSSPPPAGWVDGDWPALADAGYVDAAFPELAARVSSVSFASLSGDAGPDAFSSDS